MEGDSPLQQWHEQQRHDVDDLDQRVDGRAHGVLVRIAEVAAGHRIVAACGADIHCCFQR